MGLFTYQKQNPTDPVDVDEDDDDEYEMWEDDDWADAGLVESVNKEYPGWFLVKLTGFTHYSFIQIEPWLAENVKYGDWHKVGWRSGCATSVGVVFQSAKDAMMFKLRWR